MIGLDFPVKPEWIHDVHHLWQPEQPVTELVQAAVTQTMQELGGQKTRRNSLGIILRYFVATQGRGQSRRTAARDIWVSYSQTYPATTMAPAYLAHLIFQNEVAQAVSQFLIQRYSPTALFSSSEVRQHLSATYGQRKVVTNAASAFLRSLNAFGVLTAGPERGAYIFTKRLPVLTEIFPLLVWAWWQVHRSPQIDLAAFAAAPALAFLQTEELAIQWGTYQTTLWSLDERLEGQRATLKQAEGELFESLLFQLLPN